MYTANDYYDTYLSQSSNVPPANYSGSLADWKKETESITMSGENPLVGVTDPSNWIEDFDNKYNDEALFNLAYNSVINDPDKFSVIFESMINMLYRLRTSNDSAYSDYYYKFKRFMFLNIDGCMMTSMYKIINSHELETKYNHHMCSTPFGYLYIVIDTQKVYHDSSNGNRYCLKDGINNYTKFAMNALMEPGNPHYTDYVDVYKFDNNPNDEYRMSDDDRYIAKSYISHIKEIGRNKLLVMTMSSEEFLLSANLSIDKFNFGVVYKVVYSYGATEYYMKTMYRGTTAMTRLDEEFLKSLSNDIARTNDIKAGTGGTGGGSTTEYYWNHTKSNDYNDIHNIKREYIKSIQTQPIELYFPELKGKKIFDRPIVAVTLDKDNVFNTYVNKSYKDIREYYIYRYNKRIDGEMICYNTKDPHKIYILNQTQFNEDLFIIGGDFNSNIRNGSICVIGERLSELCEGCIRDEYPHHFGIRNGYYCRVIPFSLNDEEGLSVEYKTKFRTYSIVIITSEIWTSNKVVTYVDNWHFNNAFREEIHQMFGI